jgi:hypothetical protein
MNKAFKRKLGKRKPKKVIITKEICLRLAKKMVDDLTIMDTCASPYREAWIEMSNEDEDCIWHIQWAADCIYEELTRVNKL